MPLRPKPFSRAYDIHVSLTILIAYRTGLGKIRKAAIRRFEATIPSLKASSQTFRSGEASVTEHMVAIFDTEGAADAAARDLESAGFPPQSIRRYRADSARPSSGSAAGAADPAPSDGGFWGWLLGDEGDTTRAAYGRDEEWYSTGALVPERRS